jgi:hypothetical protein
MQEYGTSIQSEASCHICKDRNHPMAVCTSRQGVPARCPSWRSSPCCGPCCPAWPGMQCTAMCSHQKTQALDGGACSSSGQAQNLGPSTQAFMDCAPRLLICLRLSDPASLLCCGLPAAATMQRSSSGPQPLAAATSSRAALNSLKPILCCPRGFTWAPQQRRGLELAGCAPAR